MTGLTVPTPHGPARVQLRCCSQGSAALLLGHGAGGTLSAPDLVATTEATTAAGVHVALVEQPYRVAGRRAPAPARQLDEAWLAVTARLAEGVFADLPLVFGGRSSGARVACRTAAEGGAFAVLCLAFPLHPPGRPDKSRHDELDRVDVPVLVVQGERDPFGRPEPRAGREIVLLPGDHSLQTDSAAVGHAVATWLRRSLGRPGQRGTELCGCRRCAARTADTEPEMSAEWVCRVGRCSKRGDHSPETFSSGRT